jgi:SHS2 domain-containing protein
MLMSYEELEHTADILIRVRGSTIEDLFEEAARAMFCIMFGESRKESVIHTFSLSSIDLDSLLQEFLSELLYITEVEQMVFSSVDVELEEQNSMHVVAKGELFDADRHTGGTEIKGVSYSGLRIIKNTEGYVVDVLFDV